MRDIIRKKPKTLKGFSIGEVVLSAFVLTAGIMAAMALISRSMQHAYDNRDAIIAAELAQEGIELVRNVRDNDLAAGNDGFSGFSPSNKHCRIQYNDSSMTCSPSQGNPASRSYNIAVSGGRFQHMNSNQRFKRYINVDYNNGQKTATVVSYVFWDWPNNTSMPSYIPNNGSTANCTLVNKCTFTEAYLREWHK